MPRSKKAHGGLPSLRGARAKRSSGGGGGGTSAGGSWREWKVYLNEDVFRGNHAGSRAELYARVRRAGARTETCYSVGVTHVVTAGAGAGGGGGATSSAAGGSSIGGGGGVAELDDTTKILRGAVMRSGFLRSGSRRSKDLLLKAAQSRREPSTPADQGNDNGGPGAGASPRGATTPTPGMPAVVPLHTFLVWLAHRESALGLPVATPATTNPRSRRAASLSASAAGVTGTGVAEGAVHSCVAGARSRAGSNVSMGTQNRARHASHRHHRHHNKINNSISHPEVGPGGELYPEVYPQVAMTPARSDEMSSNCMSGDIDPAPAAAKLHAAMRQQLQAGPRTGVTGDICSGNIRYVGGHGVRKTHVKARASSGKTVKAERKHGVAMSASSSSSSSSASTSTSPCAMMVVYDHLTQHKVMAEIFPEIKKGAGSTIPTLYDDAPVGMSPFELATKNSTSSAIARERERSIGGSAAVTAKRRKLLAQKLKKPLAGYCENCHERYTDLWAHCASAKHSQFACSQTNFQQLDSFLEMLSKARNRSQRRARSPQRRKKIRGGKQDDATAAAEAAVVAEAAVAAAAKRAAEEEGKIARAKAVAAAARRAKIVVEAAAAQAAGAKSRRSKRLKRRQVSGGGGTTPRNSNPSSIPASMAANFEIPRSMPYNAEFASVLVGSFNNTPAPSTYDPDWVEEGENANIDGARPEDTHGDESVDSDDSDESDEDDDEVDSDRSDAVSDEDAAEEDSIIKGTTRSVRNRRSLRAAQAGDSVPPAPAPPKGPRPPRPPSQNRRAAALLANMVETSVPGVSIRVFTEAAADSARSYSALDTARRSRRSSVTAGAKRKRDSTAKSFLSNSTAATPNGASNQENVLNSAGASSASIGAVLGLRKRTKRTRKAITSSGGAKSVLGPAPCSLKKMKTTSGVGAANPKSKRLFRAKRRSVRGSR